MATSNRWMSLSCSVDPLGLHLGLLLFHAPSVCACCSHHLLLLWHTYTYAFTNTQSTPHCITSKQNVNNNRFKQAKKKYTAWLAHRQKAATETFSQSSRFFVVGIIPIEYLAVQTTNKGTGISEIGGLIKWAVETRDCLLGKSQAIKSWISFSAQSSQTQT